MLWVCEERRRNEATPAYLTTRQAAEEFQVSEDTVRRWLRTGLLRGRRLSDRAGYRIPRSEIDRVLEEGFGDTEPLS